MSDEKRNAILEAATRIIEAQGLSAPTAAIAKAAGIANGSLFTYFETKTELLNRLYLHLKGEMAAALDGMDTEAELREQFFYVWRAWTDWALAWPAKRHVLAQLTVSGEITAESRAAGHRMMLALAELVERCRAGGAMRKVRLEFVLALMNSVAEATMDSMTQNPDGAAEYRREGFAALWRMLE